MLAFRLETLDEAKVILAFHLVGTVMELFKTSAGSWLYPEPSVLRIGGVPLFSGFMYAAVGSYLARVFRIFEIRFLPWPRTPWPEVLAVAVYVNFFAHHWLPDVRLLLFAAMAALFWRTRACFTVWRDERGLPLLLGWFLVGLCIWLAENLGTFAHAWAYPNQRHGWTLVSPMKLGAWYLLMYISFVLVAAVHRRRDKLAKAGKLTFLAALGDQTRSAGRRDRSFVRDPHQYPVPGRLHHSRRDAGDLGRLVPLHRLSRRRAPRAAGQAGVEAVLA